MPGQTRVCPGRIQEEGESALRPEGRAALGRDSQGGGNGCPSGNGSSDRYHPMPVLSVGSRLVHVAHARLGFICEAYFGLASSELAKY